MKTTRGDVPVGTDNNKQSGAQRLLPTTRSQVSGHRFMRRRVEHGLIYGDIRMIHDPLASRRRSAILGVIAVALIAAGCGLFAWLRPNPDPGTAAILRATDGALYVRVGETVHPVTNLTSARLIAGAPEEPQRIGDERLAAMPRGVPVGLPTAPAMFAPADSEDEVWSACVGTGRNVRGITVTAGTPVKELNAGQGIVALYGGEEWLLTTAGRAKLPAASDPASRVLRRTLGIDASTPRWDVGEADGVLNAMRELPPIRLPDPLPEVLETETEAWILTPHGGIQQVTPTQREVLGEAGAKVSKTTASAIAAYPDANPPMPLDIPEEAPQWLELGGAEVCATETGRVATAAPHDAGGAVELSGDAPAAWFRGLAAGAVAVDTGAGYQVISAQGQRHEVSNQELLSVIGAAHTENVPWAIIRLLPAGPELNREAALTATY